MKVSVIIPCYQEEGNIQECLRRIPLLGAETECLVVDDASTDRTREKIVELMASHPHVRLIAFNRNQGKAEAVRAGIAQASGDVVMILDADMSVPPEELSLFVEAVHRDQQALVIGTRLVYPFDKRAMSWLNRMSNRVTAWLFSNFLHTRITDTLCGTKALWRNNALHIPRVTDRWGDFGFLLGAAQRNLTIVEVPVHYQPRMTGSSKMKPFPDGFLLFVSCLQVGCRLLFLRYGRAIRASSPLQ